jgi:hypothetical protein
MFEKRLVIVSRETYPIKKIHKRSEKKSAIIKAPSISFILLTVAFNNTLILLQSSS